MKIVREEILISCGPFAKSKVWATIRKKIGKAIRAVDWPVGSGSFTIFPQSGKKRNEGNGVKPIKVVLMKRLEKEGWTTEVSCDLGDGPSPGDYDAFIDTASGAVVLEWETGNISSPPVIAR